MPWGKAAGEGPRELGFCCVRTLERTVRLEREWKTSQDPRRGLKVLIDPAELLLFTSGSSRMFLALVKVARK